jgi:hypothetical protein
VGLGALSPPITTFENPGHLSKQATLKVVFLKPHGFRICEMFPSCGSHESQSLTALREPPLRVKCIE